MRHVKKGDLVEVISGNHKGLIARVLDVIVSKDRVRLETVDDKNSKSKKPLMVKRHLKPGARAAMPDGGIMDIPGTVHISNVLPVDPQSKKGTRVGRRILEDGTKVRVAKKSGEVVEGAA